MSFFSLSGISVCWVNIYNGKVLDSVLSIDYRGLGIITREWYNTSCDKYGYNGKKYQ